MIGLLARMIAKDRRLVESLKDSPNPQAVAMRHEALARIDLAEAMIDYQRGNKVRLRIYATTFDEVA